MRVPAVGALALTLILAAGGCTTQQTDPARVSWGDLIEGRRLDAYLESRRQELRALDQQSAALAARLDQRRGQLASLNRDLSQAQAKSAASRAELQKINGDVTTAQRELERLSADVERLRQESASLKLQATTAQERRAAAEQVARQEAELERLQVDITALEQAIERTLLTRARHALEAS
jgi:chromosome segregation ATPase